MLRRLILDDNDYKNIVSLNFLIDSEYCSKLINIPDCICESDFTILTNYFEQDDQQAFAIFSKKVFEKRELLEDKKLKYKCGQCCKDLSDDEECVACDVCGTWFHISANCSIGYNSKKDNKSKEKGIELY